MSGVVEGEDGALPEGWVWARLGEVLSEPLINGRSVRTKENGFPVLRLTSLKPDGVDFGEAKLGAWTEEEAEPYLVTEGDFLLSRGNGSLKLVGRGSLVRAITDPVAFPDTMIRVRTETKLLDSQFLSHLWNSPLIRTQIERAARTTAGIYKINQGILADIHIPLPPLAEQHRIVEALESHLSRLDAARHAVADAAKRMKSLLTRTLSKEFASCDAELYPLGKVAEVRLGRQRSPKNHSGAQMRPYLRAANVGWKGLVLEDVKEMNFTDKEAEIYELQPGDILLSEASGSPGEVGKPAMWRGEIKGCCFQNTLIRVRPTEDAEPLFLFYYLRYEALRGAFRSGVRGVGIHHLGAARMSSWRVPFPPREEQQLIVSRIEAQVSRQDCVSAALEGEGSISARAVNLQQALLHHAFTGRLVPQDPADEPASALLARIQEERAVREKSKPKRARRAGTGAKTKRNVPAARTHTAGPPPPPAASSAPLPANAVQPTFDVFEDQTTGRHQAPDQDETQDAPK
ncbi:restriction endonuclease subunit S [Streptomyces sp. GSL17-113]|uniref:restriction endonuclease subunit S n=1 Tax=Streptomyces sp. GSL17-113 TaxID=3115365 RepID=UPI002E767F6B|nr:restriction endonuclease subunit S [Streptomyces sp. GSL17-113]